MTRYIALFAVGMAVGIYVAAPWLSTTPTSTDQPNLEMNP